MKSSSTLPTVAPWRIGFLVARLFPMYVLVLAADAMRLANKYAVQRKFDWVFISDDGRPVEASNGMHMDCDVAVDAARDFHYAFVLAGDDQARALTRRIRQWVLRIDRSDTVLGAIDSGAFLLAECRVIRNRPVTVHPDAVSAFREQYPSIKVHQDPVVHDRKLVTCAGGLSIVTLMLSVIREHCGPAVAQSVATDMVAGGLTAVGLARDERPLTRPLGQPPAAASSIDAVIALMQENLEEPLPLQALSDRVNRSRRQLTREFQKAFGHPPMDYYRTLRLNRAKQLLFQSDLSVSKIAACLGFQSLSAFSRCFTAEFGRSPRKLLSSLRNEGEAAEVPHDTRHKRLSLRR